MPRDPVRRAGHPELSRPHEAVGVTVAAKIDACFLATMRDRPRSWREAIAALAHPEEWSVEVKVRHAIPKAEVVEATDDLLEALAPYSAAASAGAATMTLQLTVSAKTLVGATAAATRVVAEAFAQIQRARQLRSILGGEVLTIEELERRLTEPPLPELIGVAELAGLLDVTKQRVSYLAKGTAGFPKPFATLAAGPVWLKPTVTRFVETWERRPRGRPKKSEQSAAERRARAQA